MDHVQGPLGPQESPDHSMTISGVAVEAKLLGLWVRHLTSPCLKFLAYKMWIILAVGVRLL